MPTTFSEFTELATYMATEFTATLNALFGTDGGFLMAAVLAYLFVLWLIFRAIRRRKNGTAKGRKNRKATPAKGLAEMARQNQLTPKPEQKAEPEAQADTPLSLADEMADDTPQESAQPDDASTVDSIMREIADKVTSEAVTHMTPDIKDDEPAKRKAHLLEIEKQLRNLRDLHQAGLIASEIYLHKTRDLAHRIK